MNERNTIPEMTDPLGKYWEQPDRAKILVDEKYALMEKEDFEMLHNYECSFPSGAYIGKMWRRNNLLYWYDVSEKGQNFCKTKCREIILAV